MTRKEFITDVTSTAERCVTDTFLRVTDVLRGAEDGELDFSYLSPSGILIVVHVLATGM